MLAIAIGPDRSRSALMHLAARQWLNGSTSGSRSRCSSNNDNILCGMHCRRKSSPESQLVLLVSIILFTGLIEILTYAPYW